MKKWLKRIAAVFGLLLTVLAAVILFDKYDKSVIKTYDRSENLATIKSDWQGTPVDEKNRFVNHEYPFLPETLDLLKWQLSANPFKLAKQNDTQRLAVLDPTEFLDGERDGILWLGHASFFIRLAGKNILIDPVFGKPPLVKTLVDVPSPIDKIGRVDYLLISHDHRDHADENSVRQITEKFPNAHIYTGLRMDALVKSWVKNSNEMQTAGWFQQFKTPDETLKITFLPMRHWSRRGLFDTNERLWGAFMLESKRQTILFGSDSGFGSHYKEIAALFPKIDYAIIGIGAYQPRWFMQANHNNPADAMQAFVDLKAKYLIPMHFGRFDLSDEPPSQPLELLKEKASEMNLSDRIKALNINESLNLED